MSRRYKIREFVNGQNKAGRPYRNFSLTVPSQVARALPEDLEFTCSLTDEGILFAPVVAGGAEAALPSWARR